MPRTQRSKRGKARRQMSRRRVGRSRSWRRLLRELRKAGWEEMSS